jgi:hypothetical protein
LFAGVVRGARDRATRRCLRGRYRVFRHFALRGSDFTVSKMTRTHTHTRACT